MDIKNFFHKNVLDKIKNEIDNARGKEIYLAGYFDPKSEMISEVNILARGNKNMVPAIISDLKPGCVIVHNHPSGNLTPSAADIRIASKTGNKGIGFGIINNQADDIYMVVEPKKPKKIELLKKEKILSLFNNEGKLAENMNNYEFRKQQLEVVEKVVESFNQKKIYFIEAGTGTGKSFAYLIPALYWVHQNREPVVISTNTINLQEQIVKKDLIFLKKILPFSFKAVLVKGRSNYVCKRKLEYFKKIAGDFFNDKPEKKIEFDKILNWIKDTNTGTKSDINFTINSEIWSKIASETDLCLKTRCHYFDSCFFMKARKEVFSADLLIVNHHLLLSDANLKKDNKKLLPDYRHLIIDEAHNFNDIATYHLGHPFNYYSLNKYLDRIDESEFSLITRIRNGLSGRNISNKKEIFHIIDRKIIPQVRKIREQGEEYFNHLDTFFDSYQQRMLRLTDKLINTDDWSNIQAKGEKIAGYLSVLGKFLHQLYKNLSILPSELLKELEDDLIGLESACNNCLDYIDSLKFNLSSEDENFVFWLEKEGRNNRINQKNAPLNTSEILPEILWDSMDNIILTSATLTVNSKFTFFKRSLGLNKSKDLKVSSPFNYSKQARLLIPVDIPPANDSTFLDEIIDNFKEMLTKFQGSTLVLFTSYSMLNYCLQNTEKYLNRKGINILPQGRYPRHFIINQFKTKNNQIIFGTVSFWEGIDVRGNDLKYLIIMKLPFPVPTRPVAAARKEQLKKEGKNPFFHYSLPRAVIRFKQGFGRLIRSKDDRGIIINLDNRIINKSYGRIFINSLPDDCPVKKTSMNQLISYLKK
ncbi:MAG: helicase C-terminal domain-containing protein [Bacillota bacterium]